MKTFFTAVIAACLLLSCNNKSNNSDTITLQFNPPAGTKYDYNVDMNMSMNGNVSGQLVDMKNKMAVGYHFITKADSGNWKKMEASVSRIAMNMNTNGVNVDYDSDNANDTANVVSKTLGSVLGAMKDGTFNFTINNKGEVGSVTGINDMMQHAMSSVNSPAAVAMASGMSNTFNEENFKQNLRQSFNMYPDKPVKPGDTWTNTTTMNSQGTDIKMDNNYTLESVSGNIANVKVDSKISLPNAGASLNGTMTGNMKFDIPTGLALDGNLDMTMTSNINTGGQLTPMNTDIKMKISGKKS